MSSIATKEISRSRSNSIMCICIIEISKRNELIKKNTNKDIIYNINEFSKKNKLFQTHM